MLVGEHPAGPLYHVRQTATTVCTAQTEQMLGGNVDKCMDGWKVGWMDGLMDGRLDGWKDKWMD